MKNGIEENEELPKDSPIETTIVKTSDLGKVETTSSVQDLLLLKAKQRQNKIINQKKNRSK